MLVAGLLLVIAVKAASAYRTGAPLAACRSMEPSGHIEEGHKPQKLGFSIAVAPMNDLYLITVAGVEEIKGIFIQVRDSSGSTVGNFVDPPPNYKLIDCFSKTDSAFTHSNGKVARRTVTARWKSPPGPCSENLTVMASAVTSFAIFETDIKTTIVCPLALLPATSTTAPGERIAPNIANTLATNIEETIATITRKPFVTTREVPYVAITEKITLTTTELPYVTTTEKITSTTEFPYVATTEKMSTTTETPYVAFTEEGILAATEQPYVATTTETDLTTTEEATLPTTSEKTTQQPKSSTIKATLPTTLAETNRNVLVTTRATPRTTAIQFSPGVVGIKRPYPIDRPVNKVVGSCKYSDYTRVPLYRYRLSFGSTSTNGWMNTGRWGGLGGYRKKRSYRRHPKWRRVIEGSVYQKTYGNYHMRMGCAGFHAGDKVSLHTRHELRGCFCVHLSYRIPVAGDRLTVLADFRPLAEMRRQQKTWKHKYVQVDSKSVVMIRIVATKGVHSKGIVDVDNLYIIQGMCPNAKLSNRPRWK